jgi:hypothetical protein
MARFRCPIHQPLVLLGASLLVVLVTTGAKAGVSLWGLLVPKGGPIYSSNAAEARCRGTLITELQVEPGELKVAGSSIKFQDAWIEKRVEVVWDENGHRKRIINGYNLTFRLQKGGDELISQKHLFFSVDNEGKGLVSLWGPNEPTLFVAPVDKEDVSKIRISLLSNWKERRQKNIKFVRKTAR